MQHQLNVQHQSISGAFQDLNKLMQQVKIKIQFFFYKKLLFVYQGERYG
jgi:hypothetical protein